MTLKEMVEHCLKTYPDTRNSDIKLTNQIWVVYYLDKIKIMDDGYYVKLLDLYDLPREDNVKRIRATFQNDRGLYLPTDPKVLKQRRLLESQWREELGYKP